MPTRRIQLERPLRRLGLLYPEVHARALGDLVADRMTGFSALIGSWKMHRHLRAADVV